MENQEMRQALNKVEVVGVVKEHKLNTGSNKDDKGNSNKYINGSLIVSCGDSEITVKVFVNEKNKEGKVKKTYETLQKFIDEEYVTMAKDNDNAAVVRISGSKDFVPKFSEDIFVPEGQLQCKSAINVDLGFGNIFVDTKGSIKEDDYKATFDVEMFVSKIEDEIKKQGEDEEETGRVKITGYVPSYGGKIFPITLIAGIVEDEEGEFDFAEQIKDGISEGDSVNFWGDINHLSIVEKVKKGGSLGRAKVEEKRTYINELVTTGGSVVDEEKEWDEDIIEQAVKERASDMKTKEDEAKQGKNKNKGLKSSKSTEEKKERRRPKF